MSGFSAYFATPESQAPFKEAGLIRLRGSLFAIIEAAALVPYCPDCRGKRRHWGWCNLRKTSFAYGGISTMHVMLRSRTAIGTKKLRGAE